jgi:hypothetical protein
MNDETKKKKPLNTDTDADTAPNDTDGVSAWIAGYDPITGEPIVIEYELELPVRGDNE